jgi:hypothetical protein
LRSGGASNDYRYKKPSWTVNSEREFDRLALACPSDGVRIDGRAAQLGETGDFTWPVHVQQYKLSDPLVPDYWGTGVESKEDRMFFPSPQYGGTMVPGYKYIGFDSPETPMPWTDKPGMEDIASNYMHPLALRKYRKNPDFVTEFTVVRPEFSLCSVQLSDAIQRTLNEYSAVNGLEIVYTDYDLTSAPVTAETTGSSVYTEVRKSASRALQAFARVVPSYKDQMIEQTSDSFAATIQYAEDIKDGGTGWKDYQWQLGSLYFPQQKVQASGPYDFGAIAYAHTLESFDRFSGASVCSLSLAGEQSDRQSTGLSLSSILVHPMHIPGAAPPDLLSQERLYILGKPGSFLGGGEVITVSLERSSLFNLSGIPINNSRVLALRGNYSSVPTSYCDRHTLHIYLKYVKLARIFLNNVEVEQ